VFLNISLGDLEKALAVSLIFLLVATLVLVIIRSVLKIGENNDRL